MSAPFLWILLPIGWSILLALLRHQKTVALVGSLFCLLLMGIALALPIDVILSLGDLQFKIAPDVTVLGRRLVLPEESRPILVFLYGASMLWYAGAASALPTRRLILLGTPVTALLVAALAIQPFLFASFFIQIAALMSIPILMARGEKPGKGLLRFLIAQTLAMPALLFAGWTMSGVEANPGDIALVMRSIALLGIGLALLLAVFPFHTWIPLLAAETHPYLAGWLLWLFPTAAQFLTLGFLERYAWLRESSELIEMLKIVGLVMIAAPGFLALFERNLARLLGYAVIFETGFALLAFSLQPGKRDFFFLLLPPRVTALVLGAYALSVFWRQNPDLNLNTLRAIGKTLPFAAASVVLTIFSIASLPLLAAFPSHQVIWLELARQSLQETGWILLGSLGLSIAGLSTLHVFFNAPVETPWQSQETFADKVFLTLGMLLLFVQGLFPQWFALW
ncbi:MAG: proton-conducting transporter membrane subunit [Anaerolineales bacterium]|nr:hypothetical protein [Anaerolineales bacterium]MCX7609564.1 proton-conducting transporter membrane subunit [Anaerolineales bacterium]MDW8226934.1 proton-conducting transporter membrane subunit [Anaerolineales bacterium]